MAGTGALFDLEYYNLLSGIRDKLTKASIGYTILKNQIGKLNIFAKRVLSRGAVAVTEQYEANWKNYYAILQLRPDAKPKAITAAYKRLAHVHHYSLSERAKESQFFSAMMADIEEAYEVLSDSARRAAYKQVFKAKYHPWEAEAEKQTMEEIADLMALVAQEVSKGKRRKTWRIPVWSKVTQRAISIAIISLLLILIGGTSLAFVQPENALATPFKGVAITMTKVPSATISLIEEIRRVVATYERNTISTTLQSMRVTEGLKVVPAVTVSTNDMACFPSTEHCLFPDYLDKRFSQFKYTVDSDGIVSVDTSSVTTDALIEKINRWLDQLPEVK